jgi:hypothetical protein
MNLDTGMASIMFQNFFSLLRKSTSTVHTFSSSSLERDIVRACVLGVRGTNSLHCIFAGCQFLLGELGYSTEDVGNYTDELGDSTDDVGDCTREVGDFVISTNYLAFPTEQFSIIMIT